MYNAVADGFTTGSMMSIFMSKVHMKMKYKMYRNPGMQRYNLQIIESVAVSCGHKTAKAPYSSPSHCSTSLLPISCSTSLLPIRCSTLFFPIPCSTSLLPIPFYCTTSLLPIPFHCSTSLLPIPNIPLLLNSRC